MVSEYGGYNDINCVTYAGIGEAGPEIILRHDWTLTYLGAGDGQILRRNSLVPYYNDNTCFISAPSGRVDRLLVAANGLRIFNGLDGHIDPRLPTWPVGEEAGAFNAAHVEADPQSGRHEVVIGSMGGISALSVFDRIEIFAGGFEH